MHFKLILISVVIVNALNKSSSIVTVNADQFEAKEDHNSFVKLATVNLTVISNQDA